MGKNAVYFEERHVNFPNASVVRELPFCFAYLDDLLIFSASFEDHKGHLRLFFERLQQFCLRINPFKCTFSMEEMNFLGYLITVHNIFSSQEKVQVNENYPKPTTIIDLKRFYEILNFYRRFIEKEAEILQLLNF